MAGFSIMAETHHNIPKGFSVQTDIAIHVKMGIECYIPRLPRKHQSSTVPYIFTSNEIHAIFNACDNIMMKERQTSSCLIAIPALMRVLYSTGMRISEALSINNGDIDFERHVITLYNTKNGCQRLAPINSTLEVVLKQYIGYRNRLPYPNINADESPLFTSSIGERCKRRVIGKYFRTLLNVPKSHISGMVVVHGHMI